ncbi:hypothetical protein ACFUEN_15995 [Streptomyces griseorubiginosus]|uniref:SDH family Clp fold serine proteinase n=1 Tax=Streptomyces griseorubiginosus TaxID=67304 RepID=UPI0036328D88
MNQEAPSGGHEEATSLDSAEGVQGRELGGENQTSPEHPSEGSGAQEGEAGRAAREPSLVGGELNLPGQSPLYHALNSARYDRQQLIATYETEQDCRLIVMIDAIFPESVTIFEELIYDADPNQDLHLMLNSPGGDGETAIRLVRSAQARCKELTVIVPDRAKSAATLLAMGAHHILMGPVSDLGPIDPQLRVPSDRGDRMVAAKDLLSAVENAQNAIQEHPETYPIHAAMLAEIDAVLLQFARSAMERTDQLMEEALRSNPSRNEESVKQLCSSLKEPLIARLSSHAAVFGASDAKLAGLPVVAVDPSSRQWSILWRLWTKYFAMLPRRIYENAKNSQIGPSDD